MHKSNYAIIMAGGIGSRFWPMSTTQKPKQFLDILGTGKTLIQLTYERLNKIVPSENIFVVTSETYEYITLEQLPELKSSQVLCEPMRRNTAPCIAYASFKIRLQDENARVIVAPSDHLILKEDSFTQILSDALHQAETTNHLITLGIKPNRPETGYGYIQFQENSPYDQSHIKKVKTFTEKPNLELAKEFISSGDFYWNSGIFIWKNSSILRELEKHQSEIYSLFAGAESSMNTAREKKVMGDLYSVSPNISIDYGVMEKAEHVDVVLADVGWSDLGTWGSLYEQIKKDKAQNALIGKKVLLHDTKNSVIHIDKSQTAIIQGLDGYIVVQTGDKLLICQADQEQRIRQFVNELKLNDE